MKKRKNYIRWIHGNIVLLNNPLQDMLSKITTLCGKSAIRCKTTKDKEKITCKICLDKV